MGNRYSVAFAVQIERVLWYVAGEEEVLGVSGPEGVISIFRSKGLIPPSLVCCLMGMSWPDAFAVCFAACIYPNRAYGIPGQLRRRLALLLAALRTTKSVVEFLRANQLKFLSSHEIEQLLSDLSAACWIQLEDARLREQAIDERKTGAALYLATCLPEEAEKIVANWRDDACVVQYIREFLPTCPSNIAEEVRSRAGRADWKKIKVLLMERARSWEPSRIDLILGLEKHARLKAGRSLVQPSQRMISQMVEDCWESYWVKLTSGFPFYAFRSHYARWWRECVSRWLSEYYRKLERGPREFDEQAEGLKVRAAAPEGLTKEELLFFREGYRLVRTTFFRRGSAAESEDLRRVVDDIWYTRLERNFDKEEKAEEIQSIAARHRDKDISETTVNNLSHRLRLRIWAYTLARLRRLSNEQILGVKLPTTRRAAECPFEEKANSSGVLTVASVARAVPQDRTLLWAYAVHRALRSKTDPQHPDPWDFKSCVGEIWRWITAGSLELVEEAGRNGADRVDAKAVELMRDDTVAAFMKEVPALRTEEEAASYAQGEGSRLVRETESVVDECCLELVGSRGRDAYSDERVKSWRRLAASHWIAPVWYLVFVERLGVESVLERLQVDVEEKSIVGGLVNDMLKQQPDRRSERRFVGGG